MRALRKEEEDERYTCVGKLVQEALTTGLHTGLGAKLTVEAGG